MEATLETLTAQSTPRVSSPSQPSRPTPRCKVPGPRKRQPAPSVTPAFVDIADDESDEDEAPPPRPTKRRYAEMADNQRPFHSSRQFTAHQRKESSLPSRQSVGGDQRPPIHPRPAQPSAAGVGGPPTNPILVTPIQTRSPSPERGVILANPADVPHEEPTPPDAAPPPGSPLSNSHVQPDAGPPPVTPVTHETARGEHDMAMGLRKERQSFLLRAASAARGSVKMDVPKPPLRPALQPPGLFHLMACGLLQFDLDRGNLEDFEARIHEWKTGPMFMDKLFAAYGRFYKPSHQVPIFCLFHVPVLSSDEL